jgi:thioredoxin 1
MSKAAEVTSENFDQEVLKSETPVLVDFWAEWCGPCKMLSPTVDAIAEEYAGKMKVFKLDIDKESALAAKYSVMSIPTLILFKNGSIVEQITGNQPKQKIIEKLEHHLM